MPIEYWYIGGDDAHFIAVSEWTPVTALLAAEELMNATVGVISRDGPEAAAAIRELAGRARKTVLAEHLTDPQEDDDGETDVPGCECEGKGWWCQDATGPRQKFWEFDYREPYDIEQSLLAAEDES